MVLENKKKHKYVGEDRISNLPEALIHHILSFLQTKCALSTCILSKRWKCVSNSIPSLDLRWWALNCTEEHKPLKTQQFMNFLDTVLYHHEKPYIQKFYLNWNQHFDESRATKWIGIVMKRKIEEICIEAPPETSLIFPISFFTCDSLKVLELHRVELNVPNRVSFPRLKSLRLQSMSFSNTISLARLISNCPILEELCFAYCSDHKSAICIENLALKNLNVRYCFFKECTVKICAPNLSTFGYGAELPQDIVFDSFPLSLVEAEIGISLYSNLSVEKFVLVKLFEKMANVRHLKLSATSFQVLSEDTSLPTFTKLIHLEVRSEMNCSFFSSKSILTARSIFKFLQLSPNIESIVFAQSIQLPQEEYDDGLSLDLNKCLPPHLKSIKFKYFVGKQVELNAVELFLKYAGFLESITIVASPELSEDHQEQLNVTKLLLMLPKPANCVVKFLRSNQT